MPRETRYLWVGNLPEKITEERITDHFQRHGKIQSVRLQPKKDEQESGAIVAFMDIKSASKAHKSNNNIDGVNLVTEYSEPTATGSAVTRTHEPTDLRVQYTQQALNRQSTRYPNRNEGLPEDRNYERREYYGSNRGVEYNQYDNKQVSGKYEEDYALQQRGRTKQRVSNALSSRSNQTFPRPTVQSQAKVVTPRVTQPQSAPQLESQSSYLERYSEEPSNDRSKRVIHSPGRASTSGGKSSKNKRRPSFSPSQGSRSSSSSSSSRSSSSSSQSESQSRSSSKTSRLSKDQGEQKGKKELTVDDKGKNLGICIRGLPLRSTDTSLRDGLFHEYKKHGKVTSVHIFGANEDRYAVVSFKKPEDATKAYEASQDKMFFGTKIQVVLHEGFAEAEDNEFRPPEAELDEFHPKATRTLFVGNLEKEVTAAQLRDIFKPFGEIVVQDIDIKKQGAVSAYAFIQYADIASVVRSLRKMDGEHIGANKIKLGFGKSMPTTCVWLDGIAESVTEKFLCRQFSRFGPVTHAVIDKVKGRGMVYFENMEFAQHAVNEMRGRALAGKKIQVDFGSRDCQTAFFEKMERTGQLRPGERPDERMGRLYRQQSMDFEERFDNNVSTVTPRENHSRRGGNYENFEQPNNRNATVRGNFRGNNGNNRNNVNFRGRSRGKGNQGNAGGFYEAQFSNQEDIGARRSGRQQFDEFGEEYGFEDDSYEQELREYYSQRERRERGSLSPARNRRRDGRSISPFSRTSRQTSSERHYDERYSERYPERYRDTDSQSGDRDSVRSYISMRSEARREYRDRVYDEKYPQTVQYVEDRTGRDRQSVRSFSPASSEYSHGRTTPLRRSRSLTPQPKRKSEKYRTSSPQSPSRKDYTNKGTREVSRPNSPVEYDNYKDGILRDPKNKHKGKFTGDPMDITIAVKYESDSEKINKAWTSSKVTKVLPVDVDRTKKPKKQRSDNEENLNTDNSKPHKTEFMDKLSKRTNSGDLPYGVELLPAVETDLSRHKKIDRQRSRSVSSSGSRSRHKDADLDHNEKTDKLKSERTDVCKKEKSRSKANVEDAVSRILPKQDKNSQSQTPRHTLEPFSGVKQHMDKAASESESSKIDSDQDSYTERESVRSQSSDYSNLEKRKMHLLNMLQQLEDGGSTSDNDSGTLLDDDTKKSKKTRLEDVFDLERAPRRKDMLKAELEECELLESTSKSRWPEATKLKPLDTAKFKPIDSTQSYRKQMEARRLLEQRQQIKSEVHVTGSAKTDFIKPPVIDTAPKKTVPEQEEDMYDSSPEKSPKDIPSDFLSVKRRKPGDPIDYDISKSAKSKRSYRLKTRDETNHGSSSEDESKSAVHATKSKSDSSCVSRTESSTGSVGSYRFVEPRLVDPRDQLHVDPDIKSPTLQHHRLDLKELKSPVEIRTDFPTPLEIPSDTKSPRDVRVDRRTANDSKRDSPMFLPLPKFARHTTLQPSPIMSPKCHISPKVQSPQQTSPVFSKLQSPPFSPGSKPQSPQLSPAVSKAEVAKTDDQQKAATVLSRNDQSATSADTKPDAEQTTANDEFKDVDSSVTSTPKAAIAKKPELLNIVKSPISPPSPLGSSDSDILSPNSPRRPCLDDRIRALDQMMSMQQQAKAPDTAVLASSVDYREKYRIRKRLDSSTISTVVDQTKSEPSDIVKTLLARSSIFDQDSKRLEQIHEKYEPKDVKFNLNEETSNVNSSTAIVSAGLSVTPAPVVLPPSRFPPVLSSNTQTFHVDAPSVSATQSVSHCEDAASSDSSTVPVTPPVTTTLSVEPVVIDVPPPSLSSTGNVNHAEVEKEFTESLSHQHVTVTASTQLGVQSVVKESTATPVVPTVLKKEDIKPEPEVIVKKESPRDDSINEVLSSPAAVLPAAVPSVTSTTVAEITVTEVKKEPTMKKETSKDLKREQSSNHGNTSATTKSILGKRKSEDKSGSPRVESKNLPSKSGSVDNKDLFKPDPVAKASEPEAKKPKLQHQKEKKSSDSHALKRQHSVDLKDKTIDKKQNSKSVSVDNTVSKSSETKQKMTTKEADKPKVTDNKEKPHKSHHEKTSKTPSSSSVSSSSSSSSQNKDKHKHSMHREESKDRAKDSTKAKEKKEKEKEPSRESEPVSKEKDAPSVKETSKGQDSKSQKTEREQKPDRHSDKGEHADKHDKGREEKPAVDRESPVKESFQKPEKADKPEKKSSQEKLDRKNSKDTSKPLEKSKSLDKKSKERERESSSDRKSKSKERKEEDHSHSTSKTDKDKHTEKNSEKLDQKDKYSKSSTDSKSKVKSEKDVKDAKNSSKERTEKKKTQKEEPEKKKASVDKAEKIDRRELLRIVEEADRAEGIPVYESMYDKVKRRSSKEKEKEQDMFEMRMRLNQLTERRRKKTMVISDDDDSSDNSEISISDVYTTRKEIKKDRTGNKSPKKKRYVIESSSSEEDENSSLASERVEATKETTSKSSAKLKSFKKSSFLYSDSEEEIETFPEPAIPNKNMPTRDSSMESLPKKPEFDDHPLSEDEKQLTKSKGKPKKKNKFKTNREETSSHSSKPAKHKDRTPKKPTVKETVPQKAFEEEPSPDPPEESKIKKTKSKDKPKKSSSKETVQDQEIYKFHDEEPNHSKPKIKSPKHKDKVKKLEPLQIEENREVVAEKDDIKVKTESGKQKDKLKKHSLGLLKESAIDSDHEKPKEEIKDEMKTKDIKPKSAKRKEKSVKLSSSKDSSVESVESKEQGEEKEESKEKTKSAKPKEKTKKSVLKEISMDIDEEKDSRKQKKFSKKKSKEKTRFPESDKPKPAEDKVPVQEKPVLLDFKAQSRQLFGSSTSSESEEDVAVRKMTSNTNSFTNFIRSQAKSREQNIELETKMISEEKVGGISIDMHEETVPVLLENNNASFETAVIKPEFETKLPSQPVQEKESIDKGIFKQEKQHKSKSTDEDRISKHAPEDKNENIAELKEKHKKEKKAKVKDIPAHGDSKHESKVKDIPAHGDSKHELKKKSQKLKEKDQISVSSDKMPLEPRHFTDEMPVLSVSTSDIVLTETVTTEPANLKPFSSKPKSKKEKSSSKDKEMADVDRDAKPKKKKSLKSKDCTPVSESLPDKESHSFEVDAKIDIKTEECVETVQALSDIPLLSLEVSHHENTSEMEESSSTTVTSPLKVEQHAGSHIVEQHVGEKSGVECNKPKEPKNIMSIFEEISQDSEAGSILEMPVIHPQSPSVEPAVETDTEVSVFQTPGKDRKRDKLMKQAAVDSEEEIVKSTVDEKALVNEENPVTEEKTEVEKEIPRSIYPSEEELKTAVETLQGITAEQERYQRDAQAAQILQNLSVEPELAESVVTENMEDLEAEQERKEQEDIQSAFTLEEMMRSEQEDVGYEIPLIHAGNKLEKSASMDSDMTVTEGTSELEIDLERKMKDEDNTVSEGVSQERSQQQPLQSPPQSATEEERPLVTEALPPVIEEQPPVIEQQKQSVTEEQKQVKEEKVPDIKQDAQGLTKVTENADTPEENDALVIDEKTDDKDTSDNLVIDEKTDDKDTADNLVIDEKTANDTADNLVIDEKTENDAADAIESKSPEVESQDLITGDITELKPDNSNKPVLDETVVGEVPQKTPSEALVESSDFSASTSECLDISESSTQDLAGDSETEKKVSESACDESTPSEARPTVVAEEKYDSAATDLLIDEQEPRLVIAEVDESSHSHVETVEKKEDKRTRRTKSRVRKISEGLDTTEAEAAETSVYSIELREREGTKMPLRGRHSTRNMEKKENESSERFSSRGRKIIPKERDDELTSLTKKARRSSESSTGSTPLRGRRAAVSTPDPDDTRKGKTRRAVTRHAGRFEDGSTDDGQMRPVNQESPENSPLPAIRRSPRTEKVQKEENLEDEYAMEEDAQGRGSGRRRIATRPRRGKINLTIKMAEKEDSKPDEDVASVKQDKDLPVDNLEIKDNEEEPGNLVIDLKPSPGFSEMPPAVEGSPRARRGRGRPKGKKSETASMSPRQSEPLNTSLSPRRSEPLNTSLSPRRSEPLNTSLSPRRPDPLAAGSSPRSKALETGATSPKASEFSSPVVKLEKLTIVEETLKREESRKEESVKVKDERKSFEGIPSSDEAKSLFDECKSIKTTESLLHLPPKPSIINKLVSPPTEPPKAPEKDLYAWEDDDDKPLPEYTPKKRNRKRKSFDPPIYGQTSPQRVFHWNMESEAKRFKEETDAEPASKPVSHPPAAAEKLVDHSVGGYTDLGGKVKAEVKSPPVVLKSPNSEMKKENEDPDWLKAHLNAEKKEPAATIITPASPETLPTPSSLTSSIMATTALTKQSEQESKIIPSWQIHMDQVIDDVAKGNFERPDFDTPVVQPRKKQRTKSREDQHSPKGTVAQMLSMAQAQQQQKQQQQQQQALNALMQQQSQLALSQAVTAGEVIQTSVPGVHDMKQAPKPDIATSSSAPQVMSRPEKSSAATSAIGQALMKVVSNTPTSITLSKVDSLSPVSVAIPVSVANIAGGLPASSPLSPHGQLSPKFMPNKMVPGGQHIQTGIVNVSRSSTPHQVQTGHPVEMARSVKDGGRRVSDGERRMAETRNAQERRNSDDITGRTQQRAASGVRTGVTEQQIMSPANSGTTSHHSVPQQTPTNLVVEGKHSSLRSPGATSSVIQQLPQVGKSTAGLQQVGYPVSAYEAMQRSSPKDRSPAMQISPGLYHPPEVKSPQGAAGMMPPLGSVQAAVHLGVVQGQAYSIGQREASPPGQVIEKVPNPHVRSVVNPSGENRPPSSQAETSRTDSRGGRTPQSQHGHSEQQHAGLRQTSPGAMHHPMLQGHPHYAHLQPPYSSVKPSASHTPSYSSAGVSMAPSQSSHTTPQSSSGKSQSQSSTVQASELRAVLNQPSKLAQQQKFLQQQQQLAQQLQVSAAHQKEHCPSPGLQYAQHRMPFTFQEPRTSQSRAEPKVSQPAAHFEGVPSSQYTEARLSQEQQARIGGLPSSAFTPPDPRLNPAEPRPAIPQQFYHGEFRMQHPGLPYPQGSLSMGVPPRMAMDPRMMFTATPQHPEYVNHQQGAHMMTGMVPQHSQHYLLHQQGAQVERRPQEGPPGGSARPPSRSTPQPPHVGRGTPQSPAPVGHLMPPGGRQPPPAGYPVPAQQRMQDGSSHPDNFMALLTRYPVMWQGILALKNDQATVQMHFVSGGRHLAQLALPPLTPDSGGCLLRIAQRMRLEPTQLEGVSRRMQMDEDYCMLLALPCGTDHIDILNQTKGLSTGFIQYLQQKQAAGIVNVPAPGTQQPAYVIHIFPPCEFSQSNLARLAPDWLQCVPELAHLLIVIATV